MNPDLILSDKFSHQFIPQMCFMQTTEFFPNLWNNEPNQYANLLWERFAQSLKLKGYTSKINGKKIDPEDGLTIFMVRFPVIKAAEYPISGAAVFRYHRFGVSFEIQGMYCFTLEKNKGSFICHQWEDSPTQYLCVNEDTLPDDSEQTFLKSILLRLKTGQIKSPESDEAGDYTAGMFDAWRKKLPSEVTNEIFACIDNAVTVFDELLDEVIQDKPGLEPELEEFRQEMRDELYKIGVISFAMGHDNRLEHGVDFIKAKNIDDLPDDVRLILRRAAGPVGSLLEKFNNAAVNGGFTAQPQWRQKVHAFFNLIGEAEFSCLMNGFGTMIL